jgi:hypothetical protein
VAVRLADEPLCSDRLASAPTSRCPLESTVSADHWYSRSTRAATGWVNRPDRRLHPTNATASIYSLQRGSHPQKKTSSDRAGMMSRTCQNRKYDHCSQGANASRTVPGECRTTISRVVLKKFSATMQPVARMRQDITMVQRRKEWQKASILPST